LRDDSPEDQPRNIVKNSQKVSRILTGDTGGNQNDKKSQSDLISKGYNKLPSISDVMDNFSKSRQDDVMKEDSQDGFEKQTLYNFLSKSNHSHR
jgi:hypothetical protein